MKRRAARTGPAPLTPAPPPGRNRMRFIYLLGMASPLIVIAALLLAR
ncbi:hypothetical protein ACH4YN_33155 [Streptomyces griseofuscus]